MPPLPEYTRSFLGPPAPLMRPGAFSADQLSRHAGAVAWVNRGDDPTGRTGQSIADCAARMLEARAAFGNDSEGRPNFAPVLEAAQASFTRVYDGETGDRFRAAFAKNVADGAITPNDVKALVEAEVAGGSETPGADKAGDKHEILTSEFARMSAYIEALPHDAKGEAARTAFLHQSVDMAIGLREAAPAISAQLYAQAANVMGEMKPEQVRAELAEISRKDGPQGIARFAAGAAAGEAERAKPLDITVDSMNVENRSEFKADGLANVMQKVNGQIEQGQKAGTPDRTAESMGGQLFAGTAAFLTAARGSELDHNLNDHDERTGLRTAMNETMRSDFPAIYRQNSRDDGEGLKGEGFDTFTAYARFELGAPGDAHGRSTADQASRILGQKFGTLEGDLLKAGRDGGADLRRDFGSEAFGDRAHEQLNGARVLAQMIGSTRNGINQDFDVRADRAAADQTEMKEKFERASKIVGYAGKVAGEEAAPLFEKGEAVFEALANATPQQITGNSGRDVQFKELEKRFGDSLGKFRPNQDLATRFDMGANDATTDWNQYKTDRDQSKTNEMQKGSQSGSLLSTLMTKTILPSPDDPAKPAPHAEMSKNDVEHRTADAVDKYNSTHKDKLPKPAEVGEWNGTQERGMVLQIGPEDYVISSGRGGYRHFDTQQTLGVAPTPEKPAVLERDGTIQQNAHAAEPIAR